MIKKLRDEYIRTLPENKRLAIFLHGITCHMDHNEVCSWYYEFEDGIIDQWNRDAHDEFLKKANELLLENDFETIKNNLINPDKSLRKKRKR